MLEISQKPGGMGVWPNTLYTTPKFSLWESPEIKKRQKIDQKFPFFLVMSKSLCDVTRAPNLYDVYVRRTKW
jgi:hypothetical protein